MTSASKMKFELEIWLHGKLVCPVLCFVLKCWRSALPEVFGAVIGADERGDCMSKKDVCRTEI